MSPTEQITKIQNTCANCGHPWVQRKDKKSERCPGCGTSLWDVEPKQRKGEK